VGQRGLEALVGDHRADQVGRRPEQGLQEPVGLGAEGGLGQGGQLAQGRRRAVLGLAEQGDPGRGPAGEAPVGVGVGVADHQPQVLDGPLQGGVEGQRRPVVAGARVTWSRRWKRSPKRVSSSRSAATPLPRMPPCS
jgi:hypothetical protein